MSYHNGLSARMSSIIAAVLPKIAVTVSERTSTGSPKIDLATAENWLVRDELVAIYKEAIGCALNREVIGISLTYVWKSCLLSPRILFLFH